MRQSTRCHPLDLSVIQKWQCIARQVGVPHRVLPAVFSVCSGCKTFLTQPFGVREHWELSWQCALWDLLIDKRSSNSVWAMLPATMRGWYFHSAASVHLSVFVSYAELGLYSPSKFADATGTIQSVTEGLSSNTFSEFLNAINCTAYPTIKCPCGSHVFPEESHRLPLHIFLSKEFPWFTSYRTEKDELMRGMRDDYLIPYHHLSSFAVSAAVVIESGDLCFLVCALHKKGLPLSYVHAPLHPLTGYLPSIHADRTASIQPCVRTVRSAKASYNSTAFRLHKAIGSSHGLSVTSIGCQRSWNLKHTESVHYASEVVAFRNREDVQAQMRSHVTRFDERNHNTSIHPRNIEVLEDDEYVGNVFPLEDVRNPSNSLAGATVVNLPESVNARKALQDPVIQQLPNSICPSVMLNHPSVGTYGVEPPRPPMAVDQRFILASTSCFPAVYGQVVHAASTSSEMKKIAVYVTRCMQLLRNHTNNGIMMRNIFHSLGISDVSPSARSLRLLELAGCRVCDLGYDTDFSSLQHAHAPGEPCMTDAYFIRPQGRPPRHGNTVPFSMKSCSQDFELVMLASDAGDIFLRYGGLRSSWWQIKAGQRYAQQVDDDAVMEAMDSVRLMRHWTAALFLKSGFDMNDMSARYLSFIGGQSSKRCSVHAVPLCQV